MSFAIVQVQMQRDGRTVSRAAQEEMRLMALERRTEGDYYAELAAAFGLPRGWAYKVLAKAKGRGRGTVAYTHLDVYKRQSQMATNGVRSSTACNIWSVRYSRCNCR